MKDGTPLLVLFMSIFDFDLCGWIGPFAQAVKKQFGSFDKLKAQFTEQTLNGEGSGWMWLVSRFFWGPKLRDKDEAE